MNFPLFIARRYLFSKKSTHIINVISGVSMVGVAVATMALVVTLSVFNGFRDLVADLFTSFDPQLKVETIKGKSTASNDSTLAAIKALPEIAMATETVEDMAMVTYKDRQAMVRIKGVEENFAEQTDIKNILYGEGIFELQVADIHYGILGMQLAEELGTGYRFEEPLRVYAPKREGQLNMANPMEGIVEGELFSPGVLFYVQQIKYDKHYIITDIDYARQLFGLEGRISSLELKVKKGYDIEDVKDKIKTIAGDRYSVKDRYEQQEDTFKIMKIEKLIAYIFLTFILVVACFNIIGSLSMLVIDKKDDVQTLRSLGANDKQIARIFLFEGRIISAIGAIAGIILGLMLCWLQQTFGLVGLGKSSGMFIVDAYPVSVHAIDIIIIFFTVVIVGFLAVWYPVRHFAKRLV